MLKGETSDTTRLSHINELRLDGVENVTTGDILINLLSPVGTENSVNTYKFGDGKGGYNSTVVAKTFEGDATSVNGHTVKTDVPENAFATITDSEIDEICV